ncbi:5'-nucleotidase C-terminal domain-containing protein [Sulfidibacter corallicola]|uniref:5'-nucleotidase C-terminal domain-containing protein n=1 Tax=Sulfidibacter corallicola TaxID=2818388 RepID=A0A8A4TI09_SULCO|nr:5'-nucleotidase C-terminal domain-containing protein [Sulfidibacter corallicola]QTD48408.1 5'-nucleotidase C-terminal domain-containing protein [Sulfidibacter corallicola]
MLLSFDWVTSIRAMAVTACFLLLSCGPTDSAKKEDVKDDSRPRQAQAAPARAVILAINDVYRIEGAADGTLGGLARVRTLRRQLNDGGDPVLVLHAGDALAPALMSKKFNGGEQMIDVLNLLDGDGEAFDPHMVMTFGNHEFDLKTAELLDARVEQSQFTWLDTNIDWADGEAGEEVVAADHLVKTHRVEMGGLTIGLFSLTTDEAHPEYIAEFGDLSATARTTVAHLRGSGCDVVVGLTHLRVSQDQALLEELGAEGPDLIVGGHDHVAVERNVDGRWLVKADADALSARVIELERDAGTLKIKQRLVRLGAEGLDVLDPTVDERVQSWLKRFDPDGALAEPVGVTQVELNAEELTIRRYETNLGSWVADQMRDAIKGKPAQIALVNSGSLRLNDVIPPGNVTRGHLKELLPYATDLVMVSLTGADIDRALQHSVSDWNASGHFLQVSGLKFDHLVAESKAANIHYRDGDAWVPLDPAATYSVMLSGYIAGGKDGYPHFAEAKRLGEGGDLEKLLMARLKVAGKAGIAPKVMGRIQTIE